MMVNTTNSLFGSKSDIPNQPNPLSNIQTNFTSLSATASKIILSYLNASVVAGVVLKVESLRHIEPSEVSEQVIIDSQGKRTRIQDSVAPKIQYWQLKGYIQCEPYEFSEYYVTSIERKKATLESAKNSRLPIEFRVKMGKTYYITMENFETEYKASVRNALYFEMTLKEWVSLATITTEVESASIEDGDSKSIGSSSSEKMSTKYWKATKSIEDAMNLIKR